MRGPATGARRNSAILAWCIGAAMLLLGLVAAIVPHDVATQYRFLQGYIAVSGAVIPGIERLAAVSSFPEVTRLVVSLMWTLVPIFTAVYLLKLELPERAVARLGQRRFLVTFGIIIFAISIVLFAVLYDIAPEDLKGRRINATVLRAMSTSRTGLGLITGFFSAGIAMMVYAVLISLLNLRRIYFPERGGTKP